MTDTNEAQAVFDALADEIAARATSCIEEAQSSRDAAADFEAKAQLCREIAAEIRAGHVRNRAMLRYLLLMDWTKIFEPRYSAAQLRGWWLGQSPSARASVPAPQQEPPR